MEEKYLHLQGRRISQVRNQLEAGCKQISPKRWLTFNELPSVISQKTELYITTGVRTSSNAIRDLLAYADLMASRGPKQKKNKLKSTVLWDVTP
jgi:hypothetical protein